MHSEVRANETYSESKRQFSFRKSDVFKNAQSPHKWWSTLHLSLPCSALVRHCHRLLVVCESVGKANLLSDYFYCKQSRESVYLSLTLHPSHRLTTKFAFRSSKVWRLLLDLDHYGCADLLGMFPLFLGELLMFWPPSLCSVSAACSSW